MRPKTKNRVLKTITTIATITLLLSACSLDGENVVVPVVMMGVSLIWIALFTSANSQ